MEEARRDAGLTDGAERIHAITEAVAARDFDALLESWHPDVVWEHNLGGGSPEEGAYEGRESVNALFERIVAPWDSLRPVVQEMRDLGDGVYEVKGQIRSKHRGSDIEMVTPYEQRLEFRDGLLIRGSMSMGAIG